MGALIDQIIKSFVTAVMQIVLQPDNLRKIFVAWHHANEKQLIEVAQPNSNDDDLQANIDASGMADVPLPTRH